MNSTEKNIFLMGMLVLSVALGANMKRRVKKQRAEAFRARWWRDNATKHRRAGGCVPDEFEHC